MDGLIELLRERRKIFRTFGLCAAVLAFVIGFVISLHAAPDGLLRVNLPLFIVYAIFLPPIGFFIQANELSLTGRAVGVSMSLTRAMEIVLYSSAANYLPIPGGLITRTTALRIEGVPVARSASVVILFTGIAGSVSFAYAGLWTIAKDFLLGLALLLITAIGSVVCYVIARKHQISSNIIQRDFLLRIFAVIFETCSLMLVFLAVGVSIEVSQAAFLGVSGFLAMALIIFPAGLGVREVIIALLSPVVGIEPATGFLAAAAARLVGMAWLAIGGVVLLLRHAKSEIEANG